MKQCVLKVNDQINVKFEGLDPFVRRKVVESLKFMIPSARHTMQFKLGRWDGKKSFATVGGGTYLNLVERVLPIIIDAGYDIVIDDKRPSYTFEWQEVTEELFADKVWPEGHPMEGTPIFLRDYQVDAIKRYLDNPQSLQSISTGAGKTILTAALSFLCERYGRTIVVVPTKTLVEQTEEDYRNVGLDVGVYFGDRKELNHKHTICTWQSLSILSKKSRREVELDTTISGFIKDVMCVMVDEVHSLKGLELLNLMTGPFSEIPLRWGMTGTIPKEEYNFLNLLSAVGPIVGEIRAAELQERGVLANCDITVLQSEDNVEYSAYHDEQKYLSSDKKRLEWLADTIREQAKNGNTLVLVDRIETGQRLLDLLEDAVFVSGKTKGAKRKEEYKEVQNTNGKIIIATYGVASVGINIPRLFNLFMVDGGKAFERIIQSIGRLLRKANDKDYANIFDVCSTAKFSARHLSKRKVYYKEAEYPFTIKKIPYR